MATNKVSASQKYWEKRRALEDQYRLIQEQATIKKLTDDILPGALKEIQKQLAAQADLHNITMEELLADYSKRDQKKYREYVEKNYKELMNSDEKYQEFIDEYFPDYDYAKVNRLLQIRTDIFDTFAREMINKDVNKTFNNRLEDILQRTYSSNSKALARILSVDVPNKLSQSELDNILNYPWSGKTFSNRLWGNISKLEQNLSKVIVTSISSGQGVVEALRTMRNDPEICDMFKLEGSKYKKAIENLVRTEYASFAQQGIAKSYEATGVEEYDVLTAEDERVCKVCGSVERSNPYKLRDAVIGVNRGPFHGRCRCTDIPHMPDLPASIDKEYEAMFGDLLDEFAKNRFGVELTHPKSREENKSKNRYNNIKEYPFSADDKKSMVRYLKEQHGIKLSDSRKYPIDNKILYESLTFLDDFSNTYTGFNKNNPVKIPLIDVMPATKMHKAIGFYQYYSSMPNVEKLALNGSKMNSYENMIKDNKKDVDSKWFSNNSSSNRTFVHEYGHHVSNSMRWISGKENWEHKFLFDILNEYKEGGIENNVEFVKYYKTLSNEVSRYGVSNEAELFAELFAEAYGPEPRELAVMFKERLDKALKEV